jgi:hypothetical protein
VSPTTVPAHCTHGAIAGMLHVRAYFRHLWPRVWRAVCPSPACARPCV